MSASSIRRNHTLNSLKVWPAGAVPVGCFRMARHLPRQGALRAHLLSVPLGHDRLHSPVRRSAAPRLELWEPAHASIGKASRYWQPIADRGSELNTQMNRFAR